MLWMVTALLLVLWLLGMVSGYTVGAWIHVLLIFAIILLAIAVVRRGTSHPAL